MIGMAYTAVVKFYDTRTGKMSFKARPVLVIGKADHSDYVVLPISRVTKREYLDEHYDELIEKDQYPLMNLHTDSYVRTHKQCVISEAELQKPIVNFKEQYPEKYLQILVLVEEFQKGLISDAI